MKNEAVKYLPSNVFEGLTSIRAIIKARDEGISDRPIKEILYDESRKSKIFREISWLTRIAPQHGFKLTPTTSEHISELTLGKSHGGFVALCGERKLSAPNASNIVDNGFYIMLDGIEDPYNFGSAVRSIYAAGADGIVLPPRSWMSAAGIVCRSSAGASELYNASLTTPIFMIVGGELRGISKKLMAQVDFTVRIDYGRNFPAALSAQSSAAILAFEVYRQNHTKR